MTANNRLNILNGNDLLGVFHLIPTIRVQKRRFPHETTVQDRVKEEQYSRIYTSRLLPELLRLDAKTFVSVSKAKFKLFL